MSAYEDDPDWQAARAEWMRERAKDETPTAHLLRGVSALYEMHAIETRLTAVS